MNRLSRFKTNVKSFASNILNESKKIRGHVYVKISFHRWKKKLYDYSRRRSAKTRNIQFHSHICQIEFSISS